MATKEQPRVGSVDPDRVYRYAEIAELFGGVSPRRIRRWVEEGRIGYTPLPGHRGRGISGRQYLDYIARNAVEPEDR